MPIVGAIMVPHPPIILPEVGRGEEKKIAATDKAYREAVALVGELAPETIVLVSPHAVGYADYFHISPGESAEGDMGQFRARDVKIRADYDSAFVEALAAAAANAGFPAGTFGERNPKLDHGTMVPLYYVNHFYRNYLLVRIGLSGLPLTEHYRLGQMIQQTADSLNRRVVIIGSGDLSHKLREDGPYGLSKEGPEYDERIMDVMGRAAFDELFDFDEHFCDKAAECGHRSFCIMAGALDGLKLETRKLSHEGTFGVGYGICTYRVTGTCSTRFSLETWRERQKEKLAEKRRKEDAYVRLARASVDSWVMERKRVSLPPDLPDEMLKDRAGVFVSLHKDGRLRGCIGTIQATRENIAEEIVENGISAATKDPRFSPVRPDELDALEISVDILGEPEKITSKGELDVKRYGVIVSKGFRRGLLLPNLDGIDSVDEQVAIALQKAGLSKREKVFEMERFEVVRHV